MSEPVIRYLRLVQIERLGIGESLQQRKRGVGRLGVKANLVRLRRLLRLLGRKEFERVCGVGGERLAGMASGDTIAVQQQQQVISYVVSFPHSGVNEVDIWY